jgi:hypothetical protein
MQLYTRGAPAPSTLQPGESERPKQPSGKLTISSPFSTPVSTRGMCRDASSSASFSTSCSRSTGKFCFVDNLRWRKRWPVTRCVMLYYVVANKNAARDQRRLCRGASGQVASARLATQFRDKNAPQYCRYGCQTVRRAQRIQYRDALDEVRWLWSSFGDGKGEMEWVMRGFVEGRAPTAPARMVATTTLSGRANHAARIASSEWNVARSIAHVYFIYNRSRFLRAVCVLDCSCKRCLVHTLFFLLRAMVREKSGDERGRR